jgi:hypothetical protein
MYGKRSPRFIIHPSIDSLVERIAAVTATTSPDEVTSLREACRGKVRSYSMENYLRTSPDATVGRQRYEIVARFAAPGARGAA